MTLEQNVIAALRTVKDPELRVNVYDLGLIYTIAADPGGVVFVLMTLTAPNCPVAGSLPGEVERAVRNVPEVKDVKLELTFDPPWTKDRMSPAAKLFLGVEDPRSSLINIQL